MTLSLPVISAGIDHGQERRSSIFSATDMPIEECFTTIERISDGIGWTPYCVDIKHSLVQSFIGLRLSFFLFHKTDETIDGYISLNLHSKKEKALYVSYIAVDSSAQSRGVGTELMRSAVAKTRELGLTFLGLDCEYDLENVMAFYTESVPLKAGVELTEIKLDGIYDDTGSKKVAVTYTV